MIFQRLWIKCTQHVHIEFPPAHKLIRPQSKLIPYAFQVSLFAKKTVCLAEVWGHARSAQNVIGHVIGHVIGAKT